MEPVTKCKVMNVTMKKQGSCAVIRVLRNIQESEVTG